MNSYIDQITAFWNWRMINRISHAEADLYMAILNTFNSFRRPVSLTIPNSTLVYLSGFSDTSQMIKARDKLVQYGLIKYKKGKKGSAGMYTVCSIDCQKSPDFDNTSDNDLNNNSDNNTEIIKNDCLNHCQKSPDFDNNSDNDCDNINREREEIERDNIPPYSPPKGKAVKPKPKNELDTVLLNVEDDNVRVALLGFIEMRKKIKKPLSAHSLQLNINKLMSLSSNAYEQEKIVNQSVMNGWQGFYELKDKEIPQQGYMKPTGNLSDIEQQFMAQYT